MLVDAMRKLAISLLRNYQAAWLQHAAIETLLDNYPMPHHTNGVPKWREIVKSI